jgi:hypothetical protein
MDNAASSPAAKPAPVSRTRIGILGIDMVTLHTPEAIRTAIESGDIERFTGVSSDISEFPWLVRWFFPVSRFYNSNVYSFFLAFRSTTDTTYQPCRSYLDSKFAVPRDVSDIVAATADAFSNKSKPPSDRQLSDLCIRAVWRHVVPEGHPDIPDNMLAAATKQLPSIGSSFNPIAYLSAKTPTADVYSYADATLRALGDRDRLPDACVIDVAHVFFAMNMNGPRLLRELVSHVDDDLVDIFSRVGLVQNIARLVQRDGTLGGLLPSNTPAQAKSTVVSFDIRSAAKISGDLSFSFASGPGQRRCAAEPVIMAYVQAVQDELRRRKSS